MNSSQRFSCHPILYGIVSAVHGKITTLNNTPRANPMTAASPKKREHYIPLRRTDLVSLLAGRLAADPDRAASFKRFCDILSATIHFDYKRLYDDLKDTYAPFDPENTTINVVSLPPEERKATMQHLFVKVDELLKKANFTPLGQVDLERASQLRSEWGINMDVEFDLFEKLQIYARGDGHGQRCRRNWMRLGKEEIVNVPIYQRLAVVIKMKKSNRLPKDVDTDDVFLKYLKDIPQADIEMLLPGARIVMPGIHRLKVGGSMLSGFGLIAYKIVTTLLSTAVMGAAFLYGMIFAVLGYGWRQYAGYQYARRACSLRLTESLYFLTLANNSGVIHCLLDEAEEQDSREAILAYHFLLTAADPAGLSMSELDEIIERYLSSATGQPIDFEVDDALEKLERMQIVIRTGDRYAAVPLDAALERLDRTWDNQFAYHKAEAA